MGQVGDRAPSRAGPQRHLLDTFRLGVNPECRFTRFIGARSKIASFAVTRGQDERELLRAGEPSLPSGSADVLISADGRSGKVV